MPAAERVQPQGETPPDVEEVHVGEETPVREIHPLTFHKPGANPAATHDFRPLAVPFNEDEDEALEDGQGLSRHPSAVAPVHPSTPREATKAEQDELARLHERQEAAGSGESKQDSPFQT